MRSLIALLSWAAVGLAPLSYTPIATAGEWSGSVSVQARAFPNDPLDPRQPDAAGAVALEPEWFHEWNDGNQRITFAPFARWDNEDNERTHTDLRKLYWSTVAPQWELRLGINKVFWGVTESQHLVDIINQTDLVEDPDGEDKLGQPMANLALVGEHGTLDFFILPYFRERTFPATEGRPRTHPRVDVDQTQYESADRENHVDWAIRWAHTLDIWDIGLSYFDGTSRDPAFLPGTNAGEPILIPYYAQITQTGIDVQATTGPWLLKLEAIHRRDQHERFNAVTTGFEYTFNGVLASTVDIGCVVEYLYDNRDENAPVPFADDIMMGLRLVLNDTQDTEALLGAIIDISGDARLWTLEASRRLGSNWKLSADARFFQDIAPDDVFYGFRQDDLLQLTAAYYF